MIPIAAQPIAHLVVTENRAGREGYTVGNDGVTQIDIAWKPMDTPLARLRRALGLRGIPVVAMAPFIQVWQGETLLGEWSQHRVKGIYYAKDQAEIDELIASDPEALLRAFRQQAEADDAAQDQA